MAKYIRLHVTALLASVLLGVASPANSAVNVAFNGAGAHATFAIIENIGAGMGVGAHMLFNVAKGRYGDFKFNPNFSIVYGSDTRDHQFYGEYDRSVLEFAFNIDGRYYPPINSATILPWLGMGFAPLITHEEDDPGSWDDTDFEGSMSFMAGLDFPISSGLEAYGELRGKVASDYKMFRITAGLTFTP